MITPRGQRNNEPKPGQLKLNARSRGWRLGDIVHEVAPGDPPMTVELIAIPEEHAEVPWADVVSKKQLHHLEIMRRGLGYSSWDLSRPSDPKQLERLRRVTRIELLR